MSRLTSSARIGHSGGADTAVDVFGLRDQLVADYADYTRSFIRVRDEHLATIVNEELDNGLLWPDPLIQLNPAFAPGKHIDELVADGTLHEGCRRIFRAGKDQPGSPGFPLRLHRHQEEAIRTARDGGNYVLTTGTGSGKSLAYIIPIVDYVLRAGPVKGIKAIVVYPMNALANSQAGELEKFLNHGFPDDRGPVTFRRYTGQDPDEERREIIANPPDIILTNYVMLELLLTRPYERDLVKAAQGLRFLVLDELHTYRGRQGADVALLARRVREACNAHELQCVGTSATLAGEGTVAEQRAQIAQVASTIFGDSVQPEAVIGETLRRVTREPGLDPAVIGPMLRTRIEGGVQPPATFEPFVADPLAGWIETTFGLAVEPGGGRLVRATPRRITGNDGAAAELAALTGCDVQACAAAIQATLMAGYRIAHPETRFPVFAFRVHQFFSRGDTLYASIDLPERRVATTQGQRFAPGDRGRVLLPLAFCRECGQEYYVVRRVADGQAIRRFEPRELRDKVEDETSEVGYLYLDAAAPWPDEGAELLERVPEDWLEESHEGFRIKHDKRSSLPVRCIVAEDGSVASAGGGVTMHFISGSFAFCLRCGVAYSSRQRSDLGKLATLGAGGRSSATSLLSLAAIRNLRREEGLDPSARKLLSFTDNRQDASLQAGHFNDFVEVGLLRSALYRAADAAGPNGLRHDELAARVAESLALDVALFALDPSVRFAAREETDRALRDVLGYRVYRDLERGWRVTAPNLEQSGLLEIRYGSLDEVAGAEDVWASRHPLLAAATPAQRARIGRTLLDFMRRSLAIRVDYLRPDWQEGMKLRSSQHLLAPWSIDEQERLEHAAIAYPRSMKKVAAHDYGGNLYISALGGFGQFLRRPATFPDATARVTVEDARQLIPDVLEAMRVGGLVTVADPPTEPDAVPGYQVTAASMQWIAGDGTHPFHDQIRIPRPPAEGSRTNPFFVDFYRTVAADGQGIRAHEHTAQVPADERIRREADFKDARLQVLFCSPTMELGVDIAQLNVVGMRNVPPTPANYAQRSGRAGRSGQPALVFNYCASGSSHDQYFFRRPGLMVAGQVRPPRLELANEDLVRAHVHAVWLAETGAGLGTSMAEVLDVDGDTPTLSVRESLTANLHRAVAKTRARDHAGNLLALVPGLEETDWWSPAWLDQVLDAAPLAFEQACDRWRGLYRAALEAQRAQTRNIADAQRSKDERLLATRLRNEAEAQLLLLRGDGDSNRYQSDFYSYRYFASEGFLPGYSFPRLPLSAFIPGRRGQTGRNDFLSRPRFLAINEFGPRSILYHEGSRYVINRVFLPVGRTDANDLPLQVAKQCESCGYLHPVPEGGPGPDLCEHCNATLGEPLTQLLRLQNVMTKRRDRINSDEEERQHQGYELRTAVRFAEHGGRPQPRTARVLAGADDLATLTYGSAATIWRINVGWRRRKPESRLGFWLDTDNGYWAKNEQDADDPEDPSGPSKSLVVPFVEDHRNILLVEPAQPLEPPVMASLAAALRMAIQVVYQLEESELAVEPLPSDKDRRLLLLYEAAEGGAGVLRRIATEPEALPQLARAALEVCHFDPDTGEDRHHAPGAKEDCEAACYDCLMSYGNQRDHGLLDRAAVRDVLLAMSRSAVDVSPAPISRPEHLSQLMSGAGSSLERDWLQYIDGRGYELPTAGQRLVADAHARPDFVYEADQTAVYLDGPVHDYPDVADRDAVSRERLKAAGYAVIEFGTDRDAWDAILTRWRDIFGAGR